MIRELRWSTVVLVAELAWGRDAVVLGAIVVGGGSAKGTHDEKI